MSVSPGQAGVGKGGVGKDGEKETTKISKWKIYKNSVKFINLSKISVKNRKEDNLNKVFFLLTDILIELEYRKVCDLKQCHNVWGLEYFIWAIFV